jgi:transposase
MLALPPGLKIMIATKPMDMRKSFNGMAQLVEHELKKDVFSGHIFVFLNKRGDRIKLFYWDRNGYCCWYKRLEQGVFRLPKVPGKSFNVSPAELGLLLEGIDLTHRSRLRSH